VLRSLLPSTPTGSAKYALYALSPSGSLPLVLRVELQRRERIPIDTDADAQDPEPDRQRPRIAIVGKTCGPDVPADPAVVSYMRTKLSQH
jgi:hypothetical protein